MLMLSPGESDNAFHIILKNVFSIVKKLAYSSEFPWILSHVASAMPVCIGFHIRFKNQSERFTIKNILVSAAFRQNIACISHSLSFFNKSGHFFRWFH